MAGFDGCMLYLQPMLPTSLSSVLSHVAWKIAVHIVLLIQKIEETLSDLYFMTRPKPWNYYWSISKGEILLNSKRMIYVPSIGPSGLIFLIATYSLLRLSRSSKEDRVSCSLSSSTLSPDRAFVQGWGCWSKNLVDCEWQSLATETYYTNYSFILLVWVTVNMSHKSHSK